MTTKRGVGKGKESGILSTSHRLGNKSEPAQNTTLNPLSKTEINHILCRIDNFLMRIPEELSGCVITEEQYVIEVRIYERK